MFEAKLIIKWECAIFVGEYFSGDVEQNIFRLDWDQFSAKIFPFFILKYANTFAKNIYL